SVSDRDRNSMAISGAASTRRTSGLQEPRIPVAPASTRARINHHNVGCMALLLAQHGKPTFGAEFVRKKRRRKLKARHWKPTTNFRGNRSPLPEHGRISRQLRQRNRKRTRRRRSVSTRSIRNLPTSRNSTGSPAILMYRRSNHVPPAQRMPFTPHKRSGRK